MQKLQGQSGKLCKKYPHMGTPIQEKTSEAEGNWEKLEDLAQARKLKLEESYQLHRFLTQTKEHVRCIFDKYYGRNILMINTN